MVFLSCLVPSFSESDAVSTKEFKKNNFIYAFFGYAGSSLIWDRSSSCSKWRLLLSCGTRASHGRGFSSSEHGLQGTCGTWAQSLLLPGSRAQGCVVVGHRLSCSAACAILLDQGSNLCLLHWQMASSPLSHQGSPVIRNFLFSYTMSSILASD